MLTKDSDKRASFSSSFTEVKKWGPFIEDNIVYRSINLSDADALKSLLQHPDTGAFQINRQFNTNIFSALETLNHHPGGILATVNDQVIGAMLIDRRKILWNGKLRNGIIVDHLTIHPGCRRQGIAKVLQRFGFDRFNEDAKDALIYGFLQSSNRPSAEMATQHLRFQNRPLFGGMMSRLWMHPRLEQGYEIREANDVDLEIILPIMNQHFENYQFWSPYTASDLTEFLKKTYSGRRLNYYYVLVRNQKIVAGCMVVDKRPIEEVRISGLSFKDRLGSRLRGILDSKGRLKVVGLRALWFLEGEKQAAAKLVDTLRYQWRWSALLSNRVDINDPAFWIYVSRTKFNSSGFLYATNEPCAGDRDRPFYYLM